MAWEGIHREVSGRCRGSPWPYEDPPCDVCPQPYKQGKRKISIPFPRCDRPTIRPRGENMRGNISDSPCCTGCISPCQPDMKILEFAADGSMNPNQIKDTFGMELGRTVQLKKQDKDNSGLLTAYHIKSMGGRYPHRSRRQQEDSDHRGACSRPV